MIQILPLVCLPHYNDKVERIYSVVFTNIITLGGCSLISLFGLDDIILCLLFWFQIIAANYSQGFINNIYSYTWRNIDIVTASSIILYMLFYYINVIPAFILYPYFILMLTSCYSQSSLFAKSMKDYVLFVNIWHLLILYLLIMMIFFKYPHSFTNGDIILSKNIG